MISSLVSVCLISALVLLTLCVVNMYNVHTRVIPMISAFAPEERWSVQNDHSGQILRELVIGYGLWLLADCFCWQFIRMSFSIPVPDDGIDRIPPWSLYQTFHGITFNISSMLQINILISCPYQNRKHAEHNRWLKSRISAIRKNVLSVSHWHWP